MSEFLKDKLKGFWGLNAVKSFLPANPSNGDTLVFDGNDWVSGYPTDPELITEVVEISSEQLITGASIDIFTIPDGKYLKSLDIYMKYTEGTTPYTVGSNFLTIEDFQNGNMFINLSTEIFNYWVTPGVEVVNRYTWQANSDAGNSIARNSGITGGHLTGADNNKVIWRGNSMALSDGNGTVKLICECKFIDI